MSGRKFCRLCMNEVNVASRNHYSDYSEDFQTKEILLSIFPGMTKDQNASSPSSNTFKEASNQDASSIPSCSGSAGSSDSSKTSKPNVVVQNVELTSTIKLCEKCYSTINFIIGVKKTLLNSDTEKANPIKSNSPHCALCFRVETLFNKFLHKDNYPDVNVLKEIIQIALSESEWKFVSKDANICVICWSWIKKIYSFKRQCFKMEERLKLYCDKQNLRLLNDSDLFFFIEQEYFIRSGQTFQNEEIKPDVIATQYDDSHIIYHQQYYEATGEVYPNLDQYYDDDDDELKDNISVVEHSLCDEKHDIIQTEPEVINLDNNYPNVSNIKIEDTFYENPDIYEGTDHDLTTQNETVVNNDDTIINLVDDDDDNDTKDDCYIINEDNVSTEQDKNNNNWDQETVSCVSTEEDLSQSENPQAQKARSNVIYVETAQYTELYDKFVTNFLNPNSIQTSQSDPITEHQDDVVGDNLDESEDANDNQVVEEDGMLLIDDDCFEVVPEENNVIDLTNVDSYIDENKRQKSSINQTLNRGETWGCYVCVAIFGEKSSIRKHQLNHEDPWNKYGRFQCQYCPYRANWKGSVTKHENFHSEKNARMLAAMKLRYICPYCSATYSNRGDVQSHMNEHIISWKQFQCVDCMFTGNTSETLRSHYKMYHCRKKDPTFHSQVQTNLFIPTH